MTPSSDIIESLNEGMFVWLFDGRVEAVERRDRAQYRDSAEPRAESAAVRTRFPPLL